MNNFTKSKFCNQNGLINNIFIIILLEPSLSCHMSDTYLVIFLVCNVCTRLLVMKIQHMFVFTFVKSHRCVSIVTSFVTFVRIRVSSEI